MSEMNEKEALAWLVDSLGKAESCCRIIGVQRLDLRWIKAATAMNQIKEKALYLAKTGRGSLSVAPR